MRLNTNKFVCWFQNTKSEIISALLPSRFSDNHLRAEFVELVPQLFRLEAAADLGHLLAGHAGARGNERLGA